jgi:hypothetical protein
MQRFAATSFWTSQSRTRNSNGFERRHYALANLSLNELHRLRDLLSDAIIVACNNRMTVKKVCLARENSSDRVDREKSGPLEWNENKEGRMENQRVCGPSMKRLR